MLYIGNKIVVQLSQTARCVAHNLFAKQTWNNPTQYKGALVNHKHHGARSLQEDQIVFKLLTESGLQHLVDEAAKLMHRYASPMSSDVQDDAKRIL
jgi:hypothetical protein